MALCRCVGIPCYVVSGINKNAAYQVGEKIIEEDLEAVWNAVLIDSEWRLVDVFWASVCLVGNRSSEWTVMDVDGKLVMDRAEGEVKEGQTEHYINEFFFLTDPDQLIYTHFPEEPVWQLLDDPISLETFESQVYIRERFFELGMSLAERSHKECLLRTVDGEVDIYFDIPKDASHNIKYRYQLHKQSKKGTDGSMQYYPLNRYVLYQKTPSFVIYQARFPLEGRFKIDIFGMDKTRDDSPDLVCCYVIDCRKAKDPCEPLPDEPEIGWGPGEEALKVGMVATTHEAGVIETDDGKVEIRFGMRNAMSILQNLKHNELDDWLLKRHAAIRFEEDEMIIEIRLPKEGEYALKLFAQQDGFEGDLPNVCNYLIRCNKEGVQPTPFPKLHEGILGRGPLEDKLGIKSLNDYDNGVIDTEDGKLKLRFKHGEDIELVAELHHTDEDRKLMADEVKKYNKRGITSFNMNLPEKGEYGVNVFARKKADDKRLYHVHTYLVNVNEGHAKEEQQTRDTTEDKRIANGVGPRSPTRTTTQSPAIHPPSHDSTETPVIHPPSRTSTETPATHPPSRPGTQTPASQPSTRGNVQTPGIRPPTRANTQTPGSRPSTRGTSQTPTGRGTSGQRSKLGKLRNKNRAGRRKLEGEELFEEKDEEFEEEGEEELTLIQLATAKDELQVKLPARKNPLLVELRKKNAIEAPEQGQISSSINEYDEIFKVKLPDYGEYRMDIYEQQENGGLLHVVSYEIERDEDIEVSVNFISHLKRRELLIILVLNNYSQIITGSKGEEMILIFSSTKFGHLHCVSKSGLLVKSGYPLKFQFTHRYAI